MRALAFEDTLQQSGLYEPNQIEAIRIRTVIFKLFFSLIDKTMNHSGLPNKGVRSQANMSAFN